MLLLSKEKKRKEKKEILLEPFVLPKKDNSIIII